MHNTRENSAKQKVLYAFPYSPPGYAAYRIVLCYCYFRLWAIMFDSGIEFKSIVIFNLIMTLTIWIRSFFLMPLTWMQSEIPPFYISPFSRQTLNSMPDAKSKEVQRKESMTAGKGVVGMNYQLRRFQV